MKVKIYISSFIYIDIDLYICRYRYRYSLNIRLLNTRENTKGTLFLPSKRSSARQYQSWWYCLQYVFPTNTTAWSNSQSYPDYCNSLLPSSILKPIHTQHRKLRDPIHHRSGNILSLLKTFQWLPTLLGPAVLQELPWPTDPLALSHHLSDISSSITEAKTRECSMTKLWGKDDYHRKNF